MLELKKRMCLLLGLMVFVNGSLTIMGSTVPDNSISNTFQILENSQEVSEINAGIDIELLEDNVITQQDITNNLPETSGKSITTLLSTKTEEVEAIDDVDEHDIKSNKNKSSRYIIKYKEGSKNNELSKATKNKFGHMNVKKGNMYGKNKNGNKGNESSKKHEVLFVEIDEAIEFEQFKKVIIETEDMSQIEYIQPDYEIFLSELVTGEVEVDVSEETITEETPVESDLVEEPVEDNDEGTTDELTEETTETELANEGDETSENPELITPTDVNSFNIGESLVAAHTVTAGNGVTVAVIDSMIDINHQDLQNHLVTGWDFVNDAALSNTDVSDSVHGTHIAGIIAECAPEALIMPLKVFEGGRAYTSDIIEAIEYASENGVGIVNCSWGCADENLALKEAMESSEMLFVCAAGNNRINIDVHGIYPASYELDNIISVGSINADGGMSYFSNYGLTVDVAAWGREVEGLYPGGTRGTMTGTSVSVAFVSGVAALVSAQNLTISETKSRIISASDKLSCLQGKVLDGNKLNIYNAVTNTQGTIMNVDAADDFDVFGYERTPSENWELFCSLDNVGIATGNDFTLVLKNNGTLWSFGNNYNGQLGNGAVLNRTLTNESTPVQVIGLTNVVQVEAGNTHAIALKDNGTVWVWGQGGGASDNTVPIQLSGYSNIEKIAAGGYNSAVIDNSGIMTIIGGWSDTTTFNAVNEVAIGDGYCLVLDNVGNVYAVGSNTYGQLGLGDTTNRTQFTQITSLANIAHIYAGNNHSAAVTTSGQLMIWGNNTYGQLGLENYEMQTTPQQVINIENVSQVALGGTFTLAASNDNKVWSWGDNTYGQLGVGTLTSSNKPIRVNNFGSFASVAELSAGDSHSALIDSSYKVYCFGNNMSGQIGDGVPLVQTTAELAPLAQDMIEFSVGETENYGLRSDGTVWKIDSTLIPVKNLPVITTISNRLAVDQDGDVWQWSTDLVAEKVENLCNVISVSRNGNHSMALTEDGTVYCWGNNDYGQLGDGTTTNRNTPVQVTNLTNVDQISAGFESSLARVGGVVYEWGRRAFMEYEYNPETDELNGPLYDSTPVQVSGITDAVSIASGTYHDLILRSNGTVYLWGYSAGDYSRTMTSVDTTNPNTIGAGFGLNVAIKPNESNVYQWGNTSYEQWMGEFYDYSNSPTRLTMPSAIQKVFVGSNYVYAIAANGSVYSCGNDRYGLLGRGRNTRCSLPVLVNGISNLGTENNYHQLSVNDIIKGAITTENTSDYYCFTPDITDDYTFTLIDNDNMQMIISVYDPIGGIVEVSNDITKSRTRINANETIYIEILQPDNEKGKYLLSVKSSESNKWFHITLDNAKYYTDYDNGGKLYQSDISGANGNIINAYLAKWLTTDEDYLYYVARAGDNTGIYKLDVLDTSNVEKISSDNAFYLTMDGFYLYYSNWSDGGKLYRIHKNGFNKTKVCDDEVSNIQVIDDYVYYDNGHKEGKRYKISKTPVEFTTPVHGEPVN